MCRRKMRTHSEWKVQIVGLSGQTSSRVRGLGMRLATRCRISRAALLVKVTAKIWPGAIPSSIMCATRWVSVRVLPVPAPARMSTGPRRVTAALRCSGFSPSKLAMGEGS